MKKNKGSYYKGTYPGDESIILCTDSSDKYTFSGVCIRQGNNISLGDYSTNWTSNMFTEIEYNEKSVEENIREELLIAKKKLTKFDEETPTYKCAQSKIKLLEKLKTNG